VQTLRVPVTGNVQVQVLHWPGSDAPPPFLLVHGLASNAHLWDGVSEGLAARGHRVAAVDQRGHGRSDKPDEGYDFATVAADLVALIERLHLDRPVVAGQSWGGNVVLELAARRPDLVRGIACIDGGWIDLSHFETWEACEAAMAPPKSAGLPASQLDAMMRGRRSDWPEAGILGALACFEIRADGTVAPWLTFERHLQILRALWQHRPGDLYPKVDVPVLLLPCDDGTGSSDAKRAQVASADKGLSRARTHWFKAHHDVHAQHPDWVVDVLAEAVTDGFFS